MEIANDNRPSVRERVEGVIERVRDAVPLTTGLVIAVFLVGAMGGAWASKPVHRWQVNREWRERIAQSSEAVRRIMAAADAEAEATDDMIIATLGDTDARLSQAENDLRNAAAKGGRGNTDDACRIPAWRVRE